MDHCQTWRCLYQGCVWSVAAAQRKVSQVCGKRRKTSERLLCSFPIAAQPAATDPVARNNTCLLAHSSVGQKCMASQLCSLFGVTRLKSRCQMALEKICSQPYSWQNSVSCCGRVVVPISLWAVSQGLLSTSRAHHLHSQQQNFLHIKSPYMLNICLTSSFATSHKKLAPFKEFIWLWLNQAHPDNLS